MPSNTKKNFNGFGGVDISAVFIPKVVGELQNIPYETTKIKTYILPKEDKENPEEDDLERFSNLFHF